MEELVSVIVPVYKVESYLSRCVDSIINQSYRNLEIILVDDGSPDKCPEICNEFAEKDSRIRVIHKENGGLSSARNAGLDICRGEYIAFVDSDDYIAENYIEKLHTAVKDENADIAVCDFCCTGELNEVFKSYNSYDTESFVSDGKEVLRRYYCNYKGFGYVVAYNKLYSRRIMNEVRFPYGKIHEDEYVFADIMLNCGKIACVSDKLYFYFQRGDSIMSSKKCEQTLECLFEIYQERNKLYKSKGLDEFVLYETRQFLLRNGSAYEYLISCSKKDKLFRNYLSECRKNFGYIMRNKFTFKEKIKCIILCTAPRMSYKVKEFIKWKQ